MVSIFTRSIDDEEKPVSEPRDHQIVADTALVVGQERIALSSIREIGNVDGCHRFQCSSSIGDIPAAGPDGKLTHM